MKIYVLICQEADYDWTEYEFRGAYSKPELAHTQRHTIKQYYGPMKKPRTFNVVDALCCTVFEAEIDDSSSIRESEISA